jgi:hypothetical protein
MAFGKPLVRREERVAKRRRATQPLVAAVADVAAFPVTSDERASVSGDDALSARNFCGN